jgi:uncharacterized membrane protein
VAAGRWRWEAVAVGSRALPLSLPAALVTAATITAAIAYSWALLARHAAYRSAAYDLAFFDQIAWNTSEGRWFETSFLAYNFLGQHLEPVLLVFAAVYRVAPKVEFLLIAQSVAVAAAAIPLYLAAKVVLRSHASGALMAAGFLLLPPVHGAALFDYHSEVLAPLGLFAAFALAVRRRVRLSLVAAVSTLLLKEDVSLALLGMAPVYWRLGHGRAATGLAVGSMAYLAGALAAMHAVRGAAPNDLYERYEYLGAPAIAVGAAIEHLVGGGGLAAVGAMLGAMALLPLATPVAGGAVPLMVLNGLSSHDPQASLVLHYAILPVTLLTVASVFGAANLARRLPERSRLLPATVFFAAALAAFVAASPLGPVRLDRTQFERSPHHDAVAAMIEAIPADASVAAQSGILPHVSQREQVYEFPDVRHSEFVLIDRTGWRSSQSTTAGYEYVLASLPERGYCLASAVDGIELYRRCE